MISRNVAILCFIMSVTLSAQSEVMKVSQAAQDDRNEGAATDLFHNPYNKLSAHHRPVGKGATYGIPGTTGAPTRGRLDVVTLFRCGSSQQGRKYIYEVSESDPLRTIKTNSSSPSDSGLPATRHVPAGLKLPSDHGDCNVILCYKNKSGQDMAEMYMNWDDKKGTAKYRREWPLAGLDVTDQSDSYFRGSSASRLRWPGTILRGFEINAPHPGPINHCLNVTATSHSRRGAPKDRQVLGKTFVWPAYGMDGTAMQPQKNLGDIPYGTRLVIRWEDRNLRSTLGLSPRGLVLFDTLLYYGVYIADEQGEYDSKNNGAVLQLRIDQDVEPVQDLNDNLAKLLPYLWPVRNPRPLDKETEIWTDGLPYAGGGGPLDPMKSVNNAWDAK